MKVDVRRVDQSSHPARAGEAVELSESRLREIASIIHGNDPFGRRSSLRVPVQGFVHIAAVSGSGAASQDQRRVGVYDLSQTGVAVVDAHPMTPGTKFKIFFPRDTGPAIELLCTARHSRKQGDEAYVTGAEFGASWMSALGAAIVGA